MRNVLYSAIFPPILGRLFFFFFSLCVCTYLQMLSRLIKVSEGLTSSYIVDPETCHAVISVGCRERLQKVLCNIAKQGFAVEITYPTELRSMLM